MRNVLEEFYGNYGLRHPTILGVREHVFNGRFVNVFNVCHFFLKHIADHFLTAPSLLSLMLLLFQCLFISVVYVKSRN